MTKTNSGTDSAVLETCPAVQLLEQAEILSVGDYMLHNWQLDALGNGEDEVVLQLSYTDDEGYITEFEFSEKNLTEATVRGNEIKLKDIKGEDCEIYCLSIHKLTLNS